MTREEALSVVTNNEPWLNDIYLLCRGKKTATNGNNTLRISKPMGHDDAIFAAVTMLLGYQSTTCELRIKDDDLQYVISYVDVIRQIAGREME